MKEIYLAEVSLASWAPSLGLLELLREQGQVGTPLRY